MYTQRNFRIVSTLTALMICCLCFLFAYYANVPKPVLVEGTIGAQAVQLAYNSALEGILQQPKASTTAGGESKKTTDFTGATTISFKSNGNLPTVGFTTYSGESTTVLWKSGDIEITVISTQNSIFGGAAHESTSKRSFHRPSPGTLIYETEAKSDSGEESKLTLTVNKDNTATSSLSRESSLVTLSNAGVADQHLLNFIPDQPASFVVKPMAIAPHDSQNTQGVKSAYNNLITAIQSAPPGEIKMDLPFPSLSKSATTASSTSSTESNGDIIIKTSETSAFGDELTIETLHPNGNVEVRFTSNGRLGSQTERYERLGDSGLSYKFEPDNVRGISSSRQILVGPDGQCVCIPERKWGIPLGLSGHAPGQQAANISWRRVGPRGNSSPLSLHD